MPKRGLSSLRSGLIRWAPSQVGAEVLGDEPFEIFAGEAFVTQDDLAGADEMMVLFQQCLGGFTFPDFRVRQASDDRHSFWRADQVQAEAPEVAGVRRAVAVAGVPGEIAAFDGLP